MECRGAPSCTNWRRKRGHFPVPSGSVSLPAFRFWNVLSLPLTPPQVLPAAVRLLHASLWPIPSCAGCTEHPGRAGGDWRSVCSPCV